MSEKLTCEACSGVKQWGGLGLPGNMRCVCPAAPSIAVAIRYAGSDAGDAARKGVDAALADRDSLREQLARVTEKLRISREATDSLGQQYAEAARERDELRAKVDTVKALTGMMTSRAEAHRSCIRETEPSHPNGYHEGAGDIYEECARSIEKALNTKAKP